MKILKFKLLKKYITMTIKDEKTYNEEERMETLLAKGTNWAAWIFSAK